ncbi:membrane protein [Sulfodiicoccus acidiphilus]|uniref:Membrane protein n=1 Tax=Sulfodiicoccus acidiphilus TaxID=1670455 RepID=A0A348B609_9CREN|nr:extracellular solute-binding protein [Sulfodiicoccus acidiphilus]BBD73611.1 membrane protein [Sulfodiicoccus acidiphilus]GGU04753.1 membrane protein [Sulfodiicoccus acidiphilus]
MSDLCVLEGNTWDDVRGVGGLQAASSKYVQAEVRWHTRSLRDFTMRSPTELAEKYDIIVMDYPAVGDLAASGMYIPMDQLLTEQDLRIVENGSIGGAFRSYFFGGRSWALPLDLSAQVSAYRPDLLSDPPRSFSSVINLLKKKEVVAAVPLSPLHAHSTFLTLLVNSIGTSELPFANLQDAILVKTLEELRSLSDYLHPMSFTSDPIDVLDEMAKRDEIGYSPFIYGYFNYSRQGYKEKVILFDDLPSKTYVPKGSVLGGAGIAVSKRVKCIPQVIDFLKWITSPQVQSSIYVTGGGQPFHVKAWLDERINLSFNNAFLNTLSTMVHAYVRPNFPGFVTLHERSGELILSMLMENGKPEETAKELKTLAQKWGWRS